MYNTLSWICFVVGLFFFGFITFPIGIILAVQGSKEGESTGVAKARELLKH